MNFRKVSEHPSWNPSGRESYHSSAHVTKIDSREDRYLLSVPGKSEQEITTRLYKDQFNLLYEGKEKIMNGFAQVYNIKNLGSQEIISFEVSNGEGASVTLQPK